MGVSAPAAKAMAATAGVRAEHLVLYHLVIEGGAVIELIDGQRTELSARRHSRFSAWRPSPHEQRRWGKRPFPDYGISAKIEARDLRPLRAGGGGDISRFVCGYMSCDPHLSRPILKWTATRL